MYNDIVPVILNVVSLNSLYIIIPKVSYFLSMVLILINYSLTMVTEVVL